MTIKDRTPTKVCKNPDLRTENSLKQKSRKGSQSSSNAERHSSSTDRNESCSFLQNVKGIVRCPLSYRLLLIFVLAISILSSFAPLVWSNVLRIAQESMGWLIKIVAFYAAIKLVQIYDPNLLDTVKALW